jgi:hypothetical protein
VVDVCELWEYEGQFLKSSLFSNTIIDYGEAFANGTLNEGHSGGSLLSWPLVDLIVRKRKGTVRNLWRCE